MWSEEWRREIKGRDGGAYITLEELEEIMEYKLARGQFRFALMGMIRRNKGKEVVEVTRKAFKIADEEGGDEDGDALDIPRLRKCIKTLCQLSGVGCATAALILAIYTMEVPVMSDECMERLGMGIKYTHKHYMEIVGKLMGMSRKVKKMVSGGDSGDLLRVTPFHVGEVLWAEKVIRDVKEVVGESNESESDSNRKRKRRNNSTESQTELKRKRRKKQKKKETE